MGRACEAAAFQIQFHCKWGNGADGTAIPQLPLNHPTPLSFLRCTAANRRLASDKCNDAPIDPTQAKRPNQTDEVLTRCSISALAAPVSPPTGRLIAKHAMPPLPP